MMFFFLGRKQAMVDSYFCPSNHLLSPSQEQDVPPGGQDTLQLVAGWIFVKLFPAPKNHRNHDGISLFHDPTDREKNQNQEID